VLHSRLSHTLRFDHRNKIWRGLQTMKFLIVFRSPAFFYFVPSGPSSVLRTLYTVSQCSCIGERPSWTPRQNNGMYVNWYSFLHDFNRLCINILTKHTSRTLALKRPEKPCKFPFLHFSFHSSQKFQSAVSVILWLSFPFPDGTCICVMAMCVEAAKSSCDIRTTAKRKEKN
jgi:hypothetical protein